MAKNIKDTYSDLMRAMVTFNDKVVEAKNLARAFQGIHGAQELLMETTKMNQTLKNSINVLQHKYDTMNTGSGFRRL